jgi:hypothetical protein
MFSFSAFAAKCLSDTLREQHYSRAEKIGEVARSCISEGEESQVIQQSAAYEEHTTKTRRLRCRTALRPVVRGGCSRLRFQRNRPRCAPTLQHFRRVRSAVSTEVGQILDADIYFNPGDSLTSFATPQALRTHTKSYDLESILTHELGHAFGFSHSAVWSAMTFPFAPAPGTYSGVRPSAQVPDAPLADDDPTGLRVLYPDPSDTVLCRLHPGIHRSGKSHFPARVATGCDWGFPCACCCSRCHQRICDRGQHGWLELRRAGAGAV